MSANPCNFWFSCCEERNRQFFLENGEFYDVKQICETENVLSQKEINLNSEEVVNSLSSAIA